MADNTRGELRLEAGRREYGGDFSATRTFAREDTRWKATGRVEHRLGDRVSVFGEAGYVDNDSNIDLRSYSGAVFQIGFRFENG